MVTFSRTSQNNGLQTKPSISSFDLRQSQLLGLAEPKRSRCQKRHAAIDIPDILPCLETNASWPIDRRFKTTHFEDGSDRQG